MRIDIMTLFPAMCERMLSESILGRARQDGLVEINCHDFRDYSTDKHRRVDDAPYGGGMGMIIGPESIYNCFESIVADSKVRPHLVYMSPQGETLTEKKAVALSQMPNIAILCGHYEGVDERLIEKIVDEEISIGDYVLTGGELAALVVTDAVVRLLPGVLSNEDCFMDESHYGGLLEYPQYTRPPVWKGLEIPPVLLSGHHANIRAWRREQSIRRTIRRRPELIEKATLTTEDKEIIRVIKDEEKNRKI